MNKRLTILSAALALGLGLSCATVGHAQDAPPAPGARDGHQWDQAGMKARFEARRAARAQLLHDALGLRPDQDAAWQAFLADSRPPQDQAGRRERARQPDAAPLTTPERLDRMAKRMAERQARFQQRADLTKRFYASLDARQQKAFDAMSALQGGDRGGMMGGRMGGRGFGGGRHGFDGGAKAVG